MKKLIVAGFALLMTVLVAPAAQTFATPEEARDALLAATQAGSEKVRALFGVKAGEIVGTGDPVQDKNLVEKFTQMAATKTKLEPDPVNPDRMTLLVGEQEWPFAVPIVRQKGQWMFDVDAGKMEIRHRLIGANELTAMDVCHGYVEAQYTYSSRDWDEDGVFEYARKLVSTPGKRDGLYWPGSDDSPVSENAAKAISQGYLDPAAKAQPYHGYFYKVLEAQGPAANGGEQPYVAHGRMIGGFALVAWPARYGVSGIMTFMVNQDGVVFEKDLGPNTGTTARAITVFNPDNTWRATVEAEE